MFRFQLFFSDRAAPAAEAWLMGRTIIGNDLPPGSACTK